MSDIFLSTKAQLQEADESKCSVDLYAISHRCGSFDRNIAASQAKSRETYKSVIPRGAAERVTLERCCACLYIYNRHSLYNGIYDFGMIEAFV